MLHIVLYEPEIPPNTGNVIRLCANTGACLHLVRPLGFRLDARSVQRSGLDYHELAEVRVRIRRDTPSDYAQAARWIDRSGQGDESCQAVSGFRHLVRRESSRAGVGAEALDPTE